MFSANPGQFVSLCKEVVDQLLDDRDSKNIKNNFGKVWRYQSDNQKLEFEGQTTQWSKEKGQEDKQHNDQRKKDKKTNNDLQNTTQKTKDWTTWTPLL
jgi:hypothetical protein